VIELSEIRAIALALPQVEEGRPVPAARRIASFKVGGKSFLGVEVGGRTMTVSLSEKAGKAFLSEDPKAYEAIWRNQSLFMGLRADLSAISPERARELIEASWRECQARGKAKK
jgi:hypothetical protein